MVGPFIPLCFLFLFQTASFAFYILLRFPLLCQAWFYSLCFMLTMHIQSVFIMFSVLIQYIILRSFQFGLYTSPICDTFHNAAHADS